VAAQPGSNSTLAASLTLRLNTGAGDHLLLLVQPEQRGQVEHPLLVRGLRRLGRRPWPAVIEHDAHDAAASAALHELGFLPGRTLRWLKRGM
jgi:hypothetical protein